MSCAFSGVWTSLLRTVGYLKKKEKGERKGTEMEEHDARNGQMTDHKLEYIRKELQCKLKEPGENTKSMRIKYSGVKGGVRKRKSRSETKASRGIEVDAGNILLKYSRRFHIFNTTTTMNVWIRRVRFWKVLRNMGVEVMVVRTNG